MPAPEALPTQIGVYKILRELGHGNMGIVYRAEDPQGNPVAIKTILPELLDNTEALRRFDREARAMARVISLNTIRILDVGREDGMPFYVMEYLRGQSLEAFLKQGKPLTLHQIVRLAQEIALGLESAHAQGVIHRDLKPDNIFLVVPHGAAKIVDFGIAREVDSSSQLTQPGDILGTPLYMAPEQFSTSVDHRADLFSFGVILYRLLTGRLPFQASNIWELADQVLYLDPPLVRDVKPDVPERLSELVRQLMNKRSELRPALIPVVLPLLREIKSELLNPAAPRTTNSVLVPLPTGSDSTEEQVRQVTPIEAPLTLPRNLELTVPGGLDCTSAGGANPASVKELQWSWANYHSVRMEESIDLGKRIRLEFMLVPPGSFWMGSSESERSRGPDEGPLHLVSINRPYFISKFPITQREYMLVMGANPSKFKDQPFANQFPVEGVSWHEAIAFCKRLASRTLPPGFAQVTLPTEAQWEYACRGGTRTVFHFGDQLNGWEANCNGSHPYGTKLDGPYVGAPSPVGLYPANRLGLFDMHGNVLEWCLDGWDEQAYSRHPKNDPFIGWTTNRRCVRGGSWYSLPRYCRAATRGGADADDRRNQIGFRVVLCLG